MRKLITGAITLLLGVVVLPAIAQSPETSPGKASTPPDSTPAINRRDTAIGKPVVTHHQITVEGKTVAYTATTGYMAMFDDSGDKSLAKMFFIAYTADNSGPKSKRPVTFVFNGGPGSSSIWLHMGSFSPVRVKFANDKGDAPSPPYEYEDNPYSWLGFTDLVFIDPISTGYSRPQKGVQPGDFHGYNEDLASVGDFIRLYITQNERWGSPKFIAGESYGTTRAAGLSGYLENRYGIYLNGITLISSILNFQLVVFGQGNEMPYIFFLPTYATTARYHHKLSPELENMTPDQLTRRAEVFAGGAYASFLLEGDRASAELTNMIVDSLHYYTGLATTYIRQARERIADYRFFKEILRDEGKIVGRYDSRFTGQDIDDAGEWTPNDPSDANISGLFIGAFNNYIRRDLGFKSDLPYEASANVYPWSFKPADNRYLDVSETLRSAMTDNPHLHVNVVCGYYDLATPVYNAEYMISHMGLRSEVRGNIILNYYEAGHMVYVSKDTDAKFLQDEKKFYESALK